MTVIGPTSLEHVAFAPVFSHAGIPQVGIDAVWEAGLLSDWQADSPIPAPPSIAVADSLAAQDSSLRALGASMTDPAWLDAFARSTMQPAWEGLALNPLLPASARDVLTKRAASADLVQVRVDADAVWQAYVANPGSSDDLAKAISGLIQAREGQSVAAIINGADAGAALAARTSLVEATGGASGENARIVRRAVSLIDGGSIVAETARSSRGVIDISVVSALSELFDTGAISADEIEARLHHDAKGLARRLGGPVADMAPGRARASMTKEAEEVLDQFEVFSLIDPTPAARRALFWWSSLDDADISRLLDAADIETVVDWCQGTLQGSPDADEVIGLLGSMNGQRFDEFCEEVSRRPDPSEEHPALAVAIREPLRVEWRPEGVDATAAYLCSRLDTEAQWRSAFKLLANGWTRSMWELGVCAQQI